LTQNATRYRLITPKNLYLRVLAETGLLGLSAFLAFIIAILGCALSLWLSPKPEAKYWGTGGLYALIAFAFLANSFDSFAIPNMWVAFGIITAATRVSYTSSKDEIPISTMQLNPDNENP
jgi:O-antigen ligase